MSKKTRISLYAILITLAACSLNFDRADYVKWITDTDNGLLIERSTASAEYLLQYEPAFFKAIRTSENGEPVALSKISKQYDDLHHFLLKVSPNDNTFQNEQKKNQYLAYGLRRDIRFVEGTDTITETVMYHLESSGSITPYHRILVAFPKAKTTEKLQFIIDPGKLESEKRVFTFNKGAFQKLEAIQERIE